MRLTDTSLQGSESYPCRRLAKVTIAVCTYNRAEILKGTIESFLRLDMPEAVELLVVDNNSNDCTRDLVGRYVAANGDLIRYVSEPKQGLSHARNRAIFESHADYLAYVDDDVFFDFDWLASMLAAFDQAPDAVCVGGKTIPHFESGRPEWVSDGLATVYGVTSFGEQFRRVAYPEHPFGVNMIFRRSVFDVVGRFDARLGRSKNSLLSNEESDLFRRIAIAGLSVYYMPAAQLMHRIPKERTSKSWVLSRYYWQGISDVVFKQIASANGDWRKIARQAWIAITVNLFDAWWAVVVFVLKRRDRIQPAGYFERKIRLAYCKGESRQLLVQLFDALMRVSSRTG